MRLYYNKESFIDYNHVKKYYFCGICYLTKIWGFSFTKTYLFNILISKHERFYTKNKDYNPLISIIVPNYNHEKFLKKRLDSIYNQRYKNYEVILLDDCSTDNSRQILLEYAKKHKNNTKILFNNKNSGGVFYQWKKALELASGDLVWIAESDDWCSRNFLNTLKKYFIDESVMIAFCRTVFIKDYKKIWTIEDYLSDIPYNWNGKFIETAFNLLNNGFAYKNIIPNVSSAIFRNTGFKNILDNNDWYNLKLCGDWLFYLIVSDGGKIAYDAKPTNFYRQHNNNTSVNIQKTKEYFKEHELVSLYIAEHYDIKKINFTKLNDRLLEMFKTNKIGLIKDFSKYYDVKKILLTNKKYHNILIASYGFCTGGGETFPIYLANELKRKGHTVTFCSYNKDNTNTDIRSLLDKSIPVVYRYIIKSWNDVIKNFGIEICYSGFLNIDFEIAKENVGQYCKHVVTLHGMYESVEQQYVYEAMPVLESTVNKWIYIADKNLVPFKENNVNIDNRFIKLPNGLPVCAINPIPRNQLGIPDNAFVMCTVSRGIKEKGWNEAIKVTTALRNKTKKDIHLIVCGDGPEYDRLKNNVPEYIHMLGFKKNTRDYIATSDLFLFPTYYKGESFPLVVIDAIFCDKPVVATDIAEIKNMLTVDNTTIGAVVGLGPDKRVSVDKLVKEIIPFINKRMSQDFYKLNNKLKKKYNILNIAEKYISIFNKVKKGA